MDPTFLVLLVVFVAFLAFVKSKSKENSDDEIWPFYAKKPLSQP